MASAVILPHEAK